MVQREIGGQARNVKVYEEHVTIVKEPESKFIGYVTPNDGCAQTILQAITDYLVKEDYSLDHLVAVLCDGTATNTGNKGGIICRLERFLERPLQWLMCLFHFNELPFRALIYHFIGKPNGPNVFKGPIGKDIHSCENKLVIRYKIPR